MKRTTRTLLLLPLLLAALLPATPGEAKEARGR